MRLVKVLDKATSSGDEVLVNVDALTSVRKGVNRRLAGGGKEQLWKVALGADLVLVDEKDLAKLTGEKAAKAGA